MKAIQMDQTKKNLEEAISGLHVVTKEIPVPKRGQVLIKVEAAPCNPSDLIFLQGGYGVKKRLPTVPGWEGAGTVIESGSGLIGRYLLGKRVACAGQSDGDGTWAQYHLAEASGCIPLSDETSFEQGAALIINPLTAVGLVEKAVKEGHKAMIQTAALSQVGRMVQLLARKKGMPLINVVHREEQLEELTASGQKWALNSSASDFPIKLRKMALELKATIAFEAVAGEITGTMFNEMPKGSKIVVYGALSEKPCQGISPLGLIFENKQIEGFWLTEWLKESTFWHKMKVIRLVKKMVQKGEFQTKINGVYGFDEWKSALSSYSQKMTDGKVILKPFS
ncbi:MAG: zinc-binding dehydrogenase [Waddliaceae bacterium]